MLTKKVPVVEINVKRVERYFGIYFKVALILVRDFINTSKYMSSNI